MKNRNVDVKKAVSKQEMAARKQKQECSTTGGRGGWDGPRANEQPGWNQGNARGGGYNQGSAGGWDGGYGGGAPAPPVIVFLFPLFEA